MDICYKVVKKINGHYYSTFARGYYMLEYTIGKVTEPKIGKIFLFKDKNMAKKYITFNDEFIMECIAQGLTYQKIGFRLDIPVHDIYIEGIWNETIEPRCYDYVYMADKVLPIELI